MALATASSHRHQQWQSTNDINSLLSSSSLQFDSMASQRPLASMARMSHASKLVAVHPRVCVAGHNARFSTGSRLHATPRGPPPPGFRLPPPTKWDRKGKSAMDHAGDYFLLTDLLRGMWVVLEQFFRPPFVV
jgi:NADH dehydrogenase (ubiquinone) Fe-S protein 8